MQNMYGDGREIPYQAVEEMFHLVDHELRIRKIEFQPFAPLRSMFRRTRQNAANSRLAPNANLKPELQCQGTE